MGARERLPRLALVGAMLVFAAAACTTLRSAPDPEPAVPGEVTPDAGSSPRASDGGATPPTDAGCVTPRPNDPDNCGKCGRSCRGGACEDGVCRAAVLADQRNSPADVAQLGAYVYWVEQGTFEASARDGRVGRVPKLPCAADAGCASELADGGVNLAGLAVDASWLYVAAGALSTGTVTRMPPSGGVLTAFGAATEIGARRVAIDKATGSVFWVDAGNADGTGTIRRRDVDMTFAATTIAGSLDFPAAVATSNGRVFYSVRGRSGLDLDGSIRACDATGASPLVIASGQAQPRGVAVDANRVYWVNRGDGTVRAARWNGTEATVLVPNCISPNAIAVDQEGITWTEAGTDPDRLDGRVRRADLDGKNVRTLAGPVPEPLSIAVDAEAVYVAVRGTRDNGYRDGRILAIVK